MSSIKLMFTCTIRSADHWYFQVASNHHKCATIEDPGFRYFSCARSILEPWYALERYGPKLRKYKLLIPCMFENILSLVDINLLHFWIFILLLKLRVDIITARFWLYIFILLFRKATTWGLLEKMKMRIFISKPLVLWRCVECAKMLFFRVTCTS